MASPFKMMYNAYVDDSHCASPSATLCEPQTTQTASLNSLYRHSGLTDQGPSYVAAISPLPNTEAIFPSTPFRESYLNDFDLSCLYTPKPTRPPRTPTQKHRFRPYTSRAPRWETPAAMAPGVGLTPPAFPSWDLASYNSDLGLSCLRPQVMLSTQPPAEGIFAFHPPYLEAASRDNEDLFRDLAASISAPATFPLSLRFSPPSPISSNPASSSSAAPVTPPGAAGDVQEGESSETGQVEEEPQPDLAVVTNPAIAATINIHSQQDAAGGVATTVGSVVLPFPANRGDLLDLLQEGLHVQCILPSIRYNDRHIVCLGKHKLQDDGRFVEGNTVCGQSCASEDLYGRHIKVVHMGMDSTRAVGSLVVRNWIHRMRPDVAVRTGDPRRVVQGARAKAMGLRIRKRNKRESEDI